VAVAVRAGRAEDGPALRRIGWAACERFRSVGLAVVADDEPATVEELAAYALDGRSWVAVEGDVPVGYVLVDLVGGNAHIEQMSVDPAHQGTGLTTYAEVPWNGPLYARWGFEELSDDLVGPELRAVRAAEQSHGLDVAERICMRLAL
jgi:hypothetical protein